MKTRRIMMLIAAAAMLALPLTATAAPMKAGKWSTTMQMDMPGMPMKMPPITVSRCVTKEEAENPQPPKDQQKNSDCKISDYKRDGNTISWTMSCEKQGVTGKGQITYSAESYDGSMQMKMGEREMSTKYSGKYLGECDEK